jgi:hypothetical protein
VRYRPRDLPGQTRSATQAADGLCTDLARSQPKRRLGLGLNRGSLSFLRSVLMVRSTVPTGRRRAGRIAPGWQLRHAWSYHLITFMPLTLDRFVSDLAGAIGRTDARKPVACNARSGLPYQCGIGPHTESATVDLVLAEMKADWPEQYSQVVREPCASAAGPSGSRPTCQPGRYDLACAHRGSGSAEYSAHREYRTKRVILEIFDEIAAVGPAYNMRLDPPPADPRLVHPPGGEPHIE